MVGLFVRMSLFGLHSRVNIVRLVIFSGGCMNLLSFVWVWLRYVAYAWVVLCFRAFVWYCAIRSRLWSRSMLSGCRRSSLVRHCCVGPLAVCHWHRYDILTACAPHLSFWAVVFPLIMAWVVCSSMVCGGVCGLCVMNMGVPCVVCEWFL